MLKRIRRAILNPGKVFSKINSRLTQGLNVDSVMDDLLRYSASVGKRPKVMLVAPKYDYGDKKRGLSVEENYFRHTLINAGYDLVSFDSIYGANLFGAKVMNKMLLESVYRKKPDIVFFILSRNEIDKATLLEIRDELGVTTLNWFCDDHWRFDDFSRDYAPCFSWVVTTDAQAVSKYKAIGVNNVILSQWACNHYLYSKFNIPYKYDVTFVGQPHGDRIKVITGLRKAGLKVETFGYGWPGGRVSTYEMNRIFCQSRININLSNSSVGRTNQIKGRDFEIPGCGGFMITGENPSIANYFIPGEEIVAYKDTPELVEKARYYLAHDKEREAIREKGYKRVLAEHTYKIRFEQIFSAIAEDKSSQERECSSL
jgi:spore maturation protein CgeB